MIKLRNSLMIKAPKKVGIEGSYLNMRKAVYDRLKANFILHGEK
jgi:hypothetical protein